MIRLSLVISGKLAIDQLRDSRNLTGIKPIIQAATRLVVHFEIIKDSDALHAVGRLNQQRRSVRVLMDIVKSLAAAKILGPGILAAAVAVEAQCNLIVHDRNVDRSFERAIIISSIIALDIAPQIVGGSLVSYQERAKR